MPTMHGNAVISEDVLPDWPPLPGEPIGEERARAYITWIRQHAPPLIAEGRRMIQAQYPTAVTDTSSVRLRELATRKLDDNLAGLSVGCVYASIKGGTWAMANISIRRDGRLEVKPGWNMG